MKSLDAVRCTPPLSSDMLMWLLGHLPEEAQESIFLFNTSKCLIGTVGIAISFLIIFMLHVTYFFISSLPMGDTWITWMYEDPYSSASESSAGHLKKLEMDHLLQ